ncbi:MAG: helix-turn-helix domain-containing protein [Clostridiaceae bacterium]
MGNINIITNDNKRLYPAKVYEIEETEFIRPVFDIDDIIDTLNKRQRIYVVSDQYDQKGIELEVFNGVLNNYDIKVIYADNVSEQGRNLNSILSLSEAAKKWGLSDGSTIRKAIERGKFQKHEIKQAGDIWITTYSAMERVFGPVKIYEEDFVFYDEIELLNYKDLLEDTQDNKAIVKMLKERFLKALITVRNKNKVFIMIKGKEKDSIKRIINSEKEIFSYIDSFIKETVFISKVKDQISEEVEKLKG